MAKALNLCQFIGNLGADPEVRHTQAGKAVASIRVACSESWKDQQGQQQERTEWVRATAFGKLGDFMGEYLRKGSKVYISGRMQTDKYQAQDGSDRYATKIIVNDMLMLDGAQGGGGQGAQSQSGGQSSGGAPAPGNEPADDFDDDIPFITAWSAW